MNINEEEKKYGYFQKSKRGVACQKKSMNEFFYLLFLMFIWTNRHAMEEKKHKVHQHLYYGSYYMGACVLLIAIFQKLSISRKP